MVFDLDPGPGTSIVECCSVARWITGELGDEKVYAKTSGSKGLQLYMPLPKMTSMRQATSTPAREGDREGPPEAVVSLMRKELRKNKVLIDWSQNSPSKTTVAVYSLRARSAPTVSTPVTWKEIDACAKSGDPNKLRFTASDVLRRVDKLGDLMAGLVADSGNDRR